MASHDGIKAALCYKNALFTPPAGMNSQQMLPLLFKKLFDEYKSDPARVTVNAVQVYALKFFCSQP